MLIHFQRSLILFPYTARFASALHCTYSLLYLLALELMGQLPMNGMRRFHPAYSFLSQVRASSAQLCAPSLVLSRSFALLSRSFCAPFALLRRHAIQFFFYQQLIFLPPPPVPHFCLPAPPRGTVLCWWYKKKVGCMIFAEYEYFEY